MQHTSLMSLDTRVALDVPAMTFPFTCTLSLVPLIAFWQQAMSPQHPIKGALASMVQDQLRQAPELCEPITDPALIAQHRELVDLLMSVVFPRASWDQAYAAALLPFHLQSFYATPAFERLGMAEEDGTLRGRMNTDGQTLAQVKILHAYAFILQKIYGIDLDFAYPLIFTTTDPQTGLERHFKPNLDGRFIEITTVGEVPPLTDEAKQQVLANLADPHRLMALLPPEQFVFQGFTVLTAEDVTDQEVLSALKRDLIEKESIVSNTRFRTLQDKLRTLFRKPDLLFGLAALQDGQVLVLNAGANIAYG
jgi:hypothetical protein